MQAARSCVAELHCSEPQKAAELAAFDQLNWDYLAELRAAPEFRPLIDAFYPDEVYRAALAKPYLPPTGMKRLVLLDGMPVGCGTIHTHAPGDAEIKRVYVAPKARGSGAGRALMEQLITDCRSMGFRRILLDTGAHLTTAQALYDRLGFARRDAYYDAPAIAEGKLVFYEMGLTP